MDDANVEMAVSASVLSAFKTSGQRCVTAGRLLVDHHLADQFADRFVAAAQRVTVGEPMDEQVFYGSMINRQGVEKGRRFNDVARKEGFRILLDRNNEPPPTPDGYWLRPFVYTGAWRQDSVCLTEEAFSPHVAIVPVRGVEEAVEVYKRYEVWSIRGHHYQRLPEGPVRRESTCAAAFFIGTCPASGPACGCRSAGSNNPGISFPLGGWIHSGAHPSESHHVQFGYTHCHGARTEGGDWADKPMRKPDQITIDRVLPLHLLQSAEPFGLSTTEIAAVGVFV